MKTADMKSLTTCKKCGTVLHITKGTFPQHICHGQLRDMLAKNQS
jgi:hypothetical protein